MSASAALLDLSSTGARVRGDELPGTGAEVVLSVRSAKAFGTVAWARGNQRGIQFRRELSSYELHRVQHDASLLKESSLTPEDQMAMIDWVTGLAR